jgi:hypothetical protein
MPDMEKHGVHAHAQLVSRQFVIQAISEALHELVSLGRQFCRFFLVKDASPSAVRRPAVGDFIEPAQAGDKKRGH